MSDETPAYTFFVNVAKHIDKLELAMSLGDYDYVWQRIDRMRQEWHLTNSRILKQEQIDRMAVDGGDLE